MCPFVNHVKMFLISAQEQDTKLNNYMYVNTQKKMTKKRLPASNRKSFLLFYLECLGFNYAPIYRTPYL
ncbi:hypothetical protein D8M06_13655 [Oceanobacillus halophilus]|uniref:Uncharacterized protein n=1 Tax=Oceanobacillus halophilus TaxID=930130 RepID=A0A495A1C7_9BACI|nr:hypothetical protein D8M06_13655 [Oceanobacillus halophilus]